LGGRFAPEPVAGLVRNTHFIKELDESGFIDRLYAGKK
jgi:hypothetical protein